MDNAGIANYSATMTENRIREFRLLRGLKGEDLAELVDTTQSQISKLERGKRQLTADWLMKIAEALDVRPEDLLGQVAFASFHDEAEAFQHNGDTRIAKTLASQSQSIFTITSNALEELGISADEPLVFNTSQAACDAAKTGDIVLVKITDKAGRKPATLVVRQFLAPRTFSTNRRNTNQQFKMDQSDFQAEIAGVHKLDPAALTRKPGHVNKSN